MLTLYFKIDYYDVHLVQFTSDNAKGVGIDCLTGQVNLHLY